MDDSIPVIAIDGTAASGKGTLAKRLADRLGYAYLDTGLLYRAVGYALTARNVPLDDKDAAITAARTLAPALLDNPALRSGLSGRAASVVAAMPEVREALDDFQRNFPARSGKPGAVLDGRDIGTAIFPDAWVKFYIDADRKVRSERRYKELVAKGEDTTFEAVLADMAARDERDGNRSFRPMKPADDAILIDTTNLNPDDVVAKALSCLPAL